MLADTEILTRQVTIMNIGGKAHAVPDDDDTEQQDVAKAQTPRGGKGHLMEWWMSLLNINFDDPEQEAPKYIPFTNNIMLATPYPGIRIKAWAEVNKKSIGVFLTGTKTDNIDAIMGFIKRDSQYLLDNLPKRTVVDVRSSWPIVLKNVDLLSDADRRAWLPKALNSFVNVLRPRLRKWYEETCA